MERHEVPGELENTMDVEGRLHAHVVGLVHRFRT